MKIITGTASPNAGFGVISQLFDDFVAECEQHQLCLLSGGRRPAHDVGTARVQLSFQQKIWSSRAFAHPTRIARRLSQAVGWAKACQGLNNRGSNVNGMAFAMLIAAISAIR
jgi:hypothetical protein